MSEYKVTSVMIDPPKEWKGPHGSVWYKSVMVEGHDKPISVGKKDPETLKAGVTLYGDIIPTDYLTDKFKATPPPENAHIPFSGGTDDHGDAITQAMCVKLAFSQFCHVETMLPNEEKHWEMISYLSDMLYRTIKQTGKFTPAEIKQTFNGGEEL